MNLPVPNASEALLREIRISQAVIRVRQLPTVFTANPLLAAFIAAAYWDAVSHRLLVAFVVAQVVLWIPAVLTWRRLRTNPRPRDVSVWNERRALGFSGIAGILWALGAWVLFPVGGPEEQATLVMLLAGLTSGSVAFFSSSPIASLAFFLPFMGSLFVQAWRLDATPVAVLPGAIGVFIACAILFTRTSFRIFVENVRVLVDRDRLLKEAANATEQLELMLTRMSDLAMVDELTGLRNRRSFFDAIEPVIAAHRRRGLPIAIALLDLDHFKAVNDSRGHAVGDAVLREVARRAQETLRAEQILGRLGGEEFVVLLPDTSAAQAFIAIERVRDTVERVPIDVGADPAIRVTLSGGIAMLTEDVTVAQALQRADRAMYRAKSLGRNRVEVAGELGS